MKALLIALTLVVAAASLSCEAPQATPYRMVDPQVTWVSSDGKDAKINIGLLDKLYAGQRLHVVRDHKLVGYVTVTRPIEYSSDVLVMDARTQPNAPLGQVRAGDVVLREFKNIAETGMPREKVARMVPVPYDPASAPPVTPAGTISGNPRWTTPPKEAADVRVIPREMVDEWIKTHPRQTQ